MEKKKTTFERGEFKEKIHQKLYNNKDIMELILGDVSECSAEDKRKMFRDHIKSHLFIDDTIEETGSFIFYDIRMPRLRENIKNCNILMYAICHRDILDNYEKSGYHGNRADILSQLIEETLVSDVETAHKFGIGRLQLDSVDIYNSKRFYGCIMQFSVPDFR